MANQEPLLVVFQSTRLSLLAARVTLSFHLHAKRNFGRKKVNFALSKVWTHNHSIKKTSAEPIYVRDNSYNFRITLSLITFKHNI